MTPMSTVPAPHLSRASNSSKWLAKMPTPRPISSIDERSIDGERIQREIEEYNTLSQQVMQLTKVISESMEKDRAAVQWAE